MSCEAPLQLAAETLEIHDASGQTAGSTSRATRSTTAPLAIPRADTPLARTIVGNSSVSPAVGRPYGLGADASLDRSATSIGTFGRAPYARLRRTSGAPGHIQGNHGCRAQP